MYESFYNFKEKPFNLNPDPDFLYMSKTHENAYTHLEYAIMENKGFVVITGEIGSGKTTMINFLLNKIRQNINVGIINTTSVSPVQFIKMICQEFELDLKGMSKVKMIDTFYAFLLKEFSEKRRVVLIIDEAQNLPVKTIEEIRMLSNLEAEKYHLIQIILVGQPELEHILQKKGLEQFAQRVTVHCHLQGLAEDEVQQYINHRLQVAGADNLSIFNKEASEAVYKYSRGIPRIINIICDAALVDGYADELKIIDKKLIDGVIRTNRFGGIFSEDTKSITEAPVSSPAKTKIAKQLAKRLQSIEKKIDLLEKFVADLDHQLNTITVKDAKTNNIILELIKMLKQSFESRMDMIREYKNLTEQEETDKP